LAKPVLLTLAGRKRTTGGGGAWDGGVVVQLDSSGAWSELVAGDLMAWNLQNFIHESTHILFHIRSASFSANNNPDRGQLYRSIDQGTTWTDVTPSSGNTEYVVDYDQDADKNMWCITSETAEQDEGNPDPSRIYKSVDNGETWTLSHKITEQSFGTRDWPAFNITCHPTNTNIIVVEGTEMVAWNFRLWRTTDGGDTWSAAINASEPSPPLQRLNTGGALQHIFNYTVAGRMLYAGSFEIANDELFFLYSDDDGDNWNLRHSEAASLGYGAVFHEETLIYLLHQNDVFELAANVGPGKVTKIADTTDLPFEDSYSFHGISRHEVTAVDTLHLGIYDSGPGSGATDDPSIYTRPADLSSGWVEHSAWATMESDLGYRVYIAINGVVGATEFEPETPRPPPPDEPPGGGGPGGGEPGEPGEGEPGVPSISQPGIGLSRKEKRDLVRARKRGRAEATKILRRQPLMITDRIDKSQIPQTAAEPTARRWLTFGWLIDAVVQGHKTMTLRDWEPIEGVQWKQGELVYAYDQPPSEGGKRIALLRLASEPFSDSTIKLKNSDFIKLGYSFALATQATPPSGRTIEQMWSDMHTKPQRLWIVRFTLERLYDQLAPERGTIGIAERPMGI